MDLENKKTERGLIRVVQNKNQISAGKQAKKILILYTGRILFYN